MRQYGYTVEVVPPPIEEPRELARALHPAQQAEALSYFKAQSVAAVVDDAWILAGDTIVALGRRVHGKPGDRKEARRILTALTGTTHHVITGVTLLDTANNRRLIQSDTTAVTMRRMSSAEMEAYLNTEAWIGKAGAYGIQDRGDAFVDRVEGSFTNVVGLPMELVVDMLRAWGCPPSAMPDRAASET